VTDDTGGTLPGATVVVVGTKLGVVTDIAGKYVINAAAGSTLKFSFVGFADQTKPVGKNLVINAKMASDSKTLEEVVVVGYSTQKKATVVGAITQVTAESLKRQGTVVSLKDALQGSMPGVTVLSQSGLPGGGNGQDQSSNRATEILIRGKNTWNNASPLILVDGVERNMDDIDVNEVETISVLKDASATAVYGMKGGNGVILITSKRGTVGKAKISVEFNQTFEGISKYSENVGTMDGFRARNLAILNEVDVVPANWSVYLPDSVLKHYRDQDLPYAFPDINWRDLMVKDFASSQRANLNVSGGNNFVKYFGSLSYLHQGDIFNTVDIGQGYDPSFTYDRFNFRTNLDFNITKTTQFIVGMSGVYGKQKRSGADATGAFTAISGHAPETPVVQYEDGVYGFNPAYTLVADNLYVTLNLSGTNVDNRTDINTDYTFIQKLDFITKGLNIKGKVAYDNYFATEGRAVNPVSYAAKLMNPNFYLAGGSYNYATKTYELNGVPLTEAQMIQAGHVTYKPQGSLTHGFTAVDQPNSFDNETVTGSASRTTLYYEASLNYNRAFGKHTVTGLALFNRQIDNSGSNWPQKREDWVGRATYDYNGRYLAEVNAAYNGSEKFGPGYKFDFFPSVALGWNISRESFVKKHAKWINNLKIKYSFGVVGNDRIVGQQWGYITTWQGGGAMTDDENFARFGTSYQPSFNKYFEGTPGNPELRWEKSEKQNIGLEFGFLKNAITGSVDVFKEHRYDMLLSGNERTIPNTFGQRPPAGNLGIVDSKGFEIEAAYQKSYDNGFNFKIGGSYTFARNEIIEKEDAELKPSYQQQAGFPIGQIRITQQTGFINSYDDLYNGVNGNASNVNVLPGDYRMMDYNGNGVIDPDDAAPYGFPVYPLNTYNGTFNVGYKGWSLNVLFYGTRNVTRKVGYGSFFSQSSLIQPHYIQDTWTPEYNNANPSFPALSFTRPTGDGTYDWYDGSLLRLRSVELSYTLPKKWSKSFGAAKTRLYANGNNLYIWTDMPADGEGSNLETRAYPLKRTATIGANIQF
jgi:TonB-linked SusC/RagA family outer membrane protein